MVGRAYTMKEMKQIVDYLVENRAYNEVRGRKMWINLASSKVIDRTWQSMKETFLKRILPDIHNPYYKLTVEQIASFRQESDIAAKNKNRLEIQTISEDSNTSDCQRTQEKSIKKEDEKAGEDTCSKIQNPYRSSTETLFLENCYETAEDIRKELESPKKTEVTQKSLRDFITYSEPLTPMLQEVIDDFASDDEPQMQIVEDPEELSNNEGNINKSKSPETIRESQSYTKKTDNVNGEEHNLGTQTSKIKSLKLKKTQKGTWENKEVVNDVSSTVQEDETNNNDSEMVLTGKENTTNPQINITEKNVSLDKNNSTTTDTPLPNNQEELAEKPTENRISTERSNTEFLESHKKNKEISRKRSRSQSSVEKKKKKKENNVSPIQHETGDKEKDTQTFDSHPQATNLQKEINNSTQKENSGKQNNQTDDTNISPNVVAEDTTVKSNEGTSQEAGPSGINPAELNPCLKSVSLFEEQFSQAQYMDSDEDDVYENNTQTSNNAPKKINHDKKNNLKKDQSKQADVCYQSQENEKTHWSSNSDFNNMENPSTSKNIDFEDVVVLKSQSETSSDLLESPKKQKSMSRIKKSKDKALANLFGFASGGVSYKRNHSKYNSRSFSQRHKHGTRNITYNVGSGSSDDYTTASDSDDVVIANSRNNGLSRKYIKPTSYDFLSHGNGVFVVGRKKIYPMLMKENGSLNYACNVDGKDHEQADSFWKKKYIEEKIRADELARLLQKTQEVKKPEPTSPILQANSSLNTAVNQNQVKEEQQPAATEKESKPDEKIKIKFNRNNDFELEGQWSNINPILERMVELFKNNDPQDAAKKPETEAKAKEDDTKTATNDNEKEGNEDKKMEAKNQVPTARKRNSREKKNMKINDSDKDDVEGNKIKSEEGVVISSGKSTPVIVTPLDSETHKKINELESEIFEKIAEIDKADSDSNITKRKRGRPKVTASIRSSASLDAAATHRASSADNAKKLRSSSAASTIKKTRTRSVGQESTKSTSAADSITEVKRPIRMPRRYNRAGNDPALASKSPRSKSKLSLSKGNETSRIQRVSTLEDDHTRYKLPAAKKNKLAKVEKPNRRYSANDPTLTSPDSSSRHSESTYGYQESDNSSPKITKRRRKMSTVNLIRKKGLIRKIKRKSCPYLADDDSYSTTESKNPSSGTLLYPSQTLNSEVYRSESYQLLMPQSKQLSQLDKIDEMSVLHEIKANKNHFDNLTPLSINTNNELYVAADELRNNSSGLKGLETNSSNVSFPLSPELSVVENMSVSKDLISSTLENHPTINETQANDEELPLKGYNKYLISEVDVSMPLMGQQCEFQTRYNNQIINRRTSFSESLLQEQFSSGSLDQKLRDMLLESAKKIAQGNTEISNKENVMEVDIVASENKTKAKKRRSSTPCKKKTVQRSKTPDIGPVLEEHTESCSRNGRMSCPPVIHVIPNQDTSGMDFNLNDVNNTKLEKGRKKKDVIKVKILRPRAKSSSKVRTQTNRLSVLTDSGINDIESGGSEGCQCCDVSTEFIHNHSDTCLHMDDCVGDSIELIENLNNSVISLNSNSIPLEIRNKIKKGSKDNSSEFVTPESFCSNARDATDLTSATRLPLRDNDDAGTEYHTPLSGASFNSLVTDDLSDESRPPSLTKWYLLSEEETNFADARSQTNNAGVGSNLNQIFTSCAVPDLSTISERSKDNDTKTNDPDSDVILKSLFDL